MNTRVLNKDEVNDGTQQLVRRNKAVASDRRIDLSDKLLNPDEVAMLLDVKMSWLMDHVTRIEPIIPHIRIGKMIRFRQSAVSEWINSLESTKATWE